MFGQMGTLTNEKELYGISKISRTYPNDVSPFTRWSLSTTTNREIVKTNIKQRKI